MSLFTADELRRFARIEMAFELNRADAERITLLGTAHIKSLLATVRHTKTFDQPPFIVENWRDMSAVRRRLFGHTRDVKVKRGNTNVPTTIREAGVVTISDQRRVGIVHERGKNLGGKKAIIFDENMWKAPLAKNEKHSRWIDRLLSYTSRQLAKKKVRKITGQRLRDSVSGVKAKQLQTVFNIVDSEWPFVPTKKPDWTAVSGEELAQVAMLFGLNGQQFSEMFRQQFIDIEFWPDKHVVAFTNKYLSVMFTDW